MHHNEHVCIFVEGQKCQIVNNEYMLYLGVVNAYDLDLNLKFKCFVFFMLSIACIQVTFRRKKCSHEDYSFKSFSMYRVKLLPRL